MGKTLKPSKEFLIHNINELRNKIGVIKIKIKKIHDDIYKIKKSGLPNTGISHEPLWKLRENLSEEIKLLGLYRNRLNEYNKKLNLFYNEHNNENISEHGITRKFLSCPIQKVVMREMGFELDNTKSFSENCTDFLNTVKNQDKMNELWEKIKSI